jgi:hypothetical protein
VANVAISNIYQSESSRLFVEKLRAALLEGDFLDGRDDKPVTHVKSEFP